MIYVGIDVGGTFTDIISYDDESLSLNVTKVLTTPHNIEEGIINGLIRYKERSSEVQLISHATTVATNALLTRFDLARTALITNKGFRDVLEIGRQRRPELYDLESKRPEPLVRRRDRFTINGRILSDGTEREAISKREVQSVAKRIIKAGYDSVVVGFLNSYVNPRHEEEVSKILLEQGFTGHIDLSSHVDREYKEFERFSTAVVNASIAPLVSRYLARFRERVQRENYNAPIYVMNSDGSASTIGQASKYPVLMIESGPAAGVLASKQLARSLSIRNALTFDMGGTTAKAGAVVEYEPDVAYEFEAAGISHSGRSIKGSGYAVRAPFIDLAEVSAGGGTIAFVDDAGSLKVGPRSAGSEPGPSSYGRGGVLPTVTDANVVLGRINPTKLLGGQMRVFRDRALDSLKKEISEKLKTSVENAAQGILSIVNNQMARAISIVSIERGRDPRDYTLIAFGGAGPIHACDLAEELEISRIIIPAHAGLFSAYGLLTADLERNFELPIMKIASKADLKDIFAKLRKTAKADLIEARDGELGSNPKFVEFVEARYLGQTYGILVPYSKGNDVRSVEREFGHRHEKLYGYSSKDEIELVNAKLRVVIPTHKPKLASRFGNKTSGEIGHRKAYPSHTRRAWISNGFCKAPIFVREELDAFSFGVGPCIIEEYDSTAIVNAAWSWKIDRQKNLILTRPKINDRK